MNQDAVNLCIDQALATFRAVDELLDGFIRECGGADSLPEKFTINVEAMTDLERRIEQSVVKGDLQKTEDLCDEYKARFAVYLNKWRAKIKQTQKVAA